eukprot:SAG25_NODE_3015_length_1269_cov_1.058169_1_plen_46_part_10
MLDHGEARTRVFVQKHGVRCQMAVAGWVAGCLLAGCELGAMHEHCC